MGDPKDVAELVGRLKAPLAPYNHKHAFDPVAWRGGSAVALEDINAERAEAAATIERLVGERDEAVRWRKRREHQLELSGRMWMRDAEEALAGDTRALRNRVEMRKLGPVEIVASDAQALAQELATLKEGMGSSRDLAPRPEPLTVPDAAVNADKSEGKRDAS